MSQKTDLIVGEYLSGKRDPLNGAAAIEIIDAFIASKLLVPASLCELASRILTGECDQGEVIHVQPYKNRVRVIKTKGKHIHRFGLKAIVDDDE
jgi:2',3'-cyclic-nucleotide 2'-phosphodiesterase (5'-nucleotidase family)